MSEENEHSREEYFHLKKDKTCKFLCTMLASFLGTLLALIICRAIHKPPMPPYGFIHNRPCPCKLMEKAIKHDFIIIPNENPHPEKMRSFFYEKNNFDNAPIPRKDK